MEKELISWVLKGKEIEEVMSEQEVSDRAADTEIFYTKHFQKVLRRKVLETLTEMAQKPDELIPKYKGQLQALYDIKSWFEEQLNASLSRFEREEDKKND